MGGPTSRIPTGYPALTSMGPGIRSARVVVPALVAVAAALVASVAFAGVAVYSNDFSSSNEAKELRHAEGKHCKKDWRKKAKSLKVAAERGRTVCGYRPPVQGDAASPNHKIRVEGKLLKSTPKKVRDRVYLGAAVRSGKDSGYELQVFPTQHKFRLVRRAGSDNVKSAEPVDVSEIKPPQPSRMPKNTPICVRFCLNA